MSSFHEIAHRLKPVTVKPLRPLSGHPQGPASGCSMEVGHSIEVCHKPGHELALSLAETSLNFKANMRSMGPALLVHNQSSFFIVDYFPSSYS